jgi:2',3'-cyclic-nucleotide 2'-phosphodiesterase (5'-nucleotidase family)
VLRILHTNDFHGSLDERRQARLQELCEDADVYFDSGDCIKAGNLGVPMRPEDAWPRLAQLNCDASVLGNRESHVLEAAFQAKIAGAEHPLLCANLRKRDGRRPLRASVTLDRNGLKIGVVGVMVAMVTERMKTQRASQYLWDPPVPVAKEWALHLRPEVDLLIALTHIGHREDLRLAEECPEYDLVLGGHSHTVLEAPVQVGSTFVCQGGSHGRFAGVYEWAGEAKFGGRLVPL